MSQRFPYKVVEGVHVEAAVGTVRGRTMTTKIESDADHAPGHAAIEERNPGQFLLSARTKNGRGSAYLTLSKHQIRELFGQVLADEETS